MRIVVLTGAGISAESGIKTFRDSNGLWEGHDVMEVASPQGWDKNRDLVLDFYNQRRKQSINAVPNKGHLDLAELEKQHQVDIITQNVDNLHEKAGSSNVLHLHGELFKSRSTLDENLIYEMKSWELNPGDTCEKGSQLRPHIVWFGEMVPLMETAVNIVKHADIFMVIGTSMVVYPAASLIDFVPEHAPKYIIDPHSPEVSSRHNLHLIKHPATTGVQKAIDSFLNQ